jgi:alkylated DNA repair protein (DNA oxidative demethylase)
LLDLFAAQQALKQEIGCGAYLLNAYALDCEQALLADLGMVIKQAPLRHMRTKTGLALSAAMTNCGSLGWVSDHQGYRYTRLDPLTQQPWPMMPTSFLKLAQAAAAVAGYAEFAPDAALINRYAVGASMGLHQDKDEQDMTQPIVSVSLGIAATFQFGGLRRTDKVFKLQLSHGDVVVWGGDARLKFHGILPLPAGKHSATGNCRINLTLRKAG